MFENILNLFKKKNKREDDKTNKETAKERLHLVLVQDRANVSADFLELMKQEIIDVIKKYIDVDEQLIDVKLTNKMNSDGTTGAPALYANIPIKNIKNDTRKMINQMEIENSKEENSKEETASKKETKKVEQKENKKTVKKEVVKTEVKEDKAEVKEDKIEIEVENIQEENNTNDEASKVEEPQAIFFENITDDQ